VSDRPTRALVGAPRARPRRRGDLRERLLVVLETLSEQITEADAELKELAIEDARMRRVMTVPGVGPVTAARFVAALDRVERFPNASRVASNLGLVPGEDTTGFRVKRKRLTRAGGHKCDERWGKPHGPCIFAARQIP
jgi:transposase